MAAVSGGCRSNNGAPAVDMVSISLQSVEVAVSVSLSVGEATAQEIAGGDR